MYIFVPEPLLATRLKKGNSNLLPPTAHGQLAESLQLTGLPYGAAHDMPSALAAMHGNSGSLSNIPSLISRNSKRCTATTHSIPTIVFHGDHDTTVNASNGSEIVAQAISFGAGLDGPLRKTVQERRSANGRAYTRTIYHSAGTAPVVEQWVLHGAGHSWPGGCSNGSFTDVSGPDASAEMVRFSVNAQLCCAI